jgi:hypothetical protein
MSIAATITDARGHIALRKRELHDDVVEPILQEVEAGHHPEWDSVGCSPICQSYRAQWNSPVVRVSVLEHCWSQLVDGPKQLK